MTAIPPLAVEEKCQAVMQAAQDIVSSFMLEVKSQMISIPKKVGAS